MAVEARAGGEAQDEVAEALADLYFSWSSALGSLSTFSSVDDLKRGIVENVRRPRPCFHQNHLHQNGRSSAFAPSAGATPFSAQLGKGATLAGHSLAALDTRIAQGYGRLSRVQQHSPPAGMFRLGRVLVRPHTGGDMDTNKLMKILIATNLLTLVLAGASAYYAIEARDSADDAYSAADSASSYASDVQDMLKRR